MVKKIRKTFQHLPTKQSPIKSTKENPKVMNKKPWTDREDDLVRSLVEKYGPQRWSFIAKFVDGRLGKQCRERWHNHLNPKINKGEWVFHEEWILYLSHSLLGNKWSEIAKLISHRTDNTIKNHWNSTMKKKTKDFERFLKGILFINS